MKESCEMELFLPCVLSLFSCVRLFATPWTVARQARFSRQEHWSGLPCSPPGNILHPGIEPVSLISPALAGGFFTTSATWKWVAQSCPILCDSMNCSLPGSSIPGILQARTLEWVAISFSRGSSQSRYRTQVSHYLGSPFIPYFSLNGLKACMWAIINHLKCPAFIGTPILWIMQI